MGDFEVSLTFSIEAEDRLDAARRVHTLLSAAIPKTFWVCNEGGVGDEVCLTDAQIGRASGEGGRRSDNVSDLADQLYRLGVQFGAGTGRLSEAEHKSAVEGVKRRLLTAAAS